MDSCVLELIFDGRERERFLEVGHFVIFSVRNYSDEDISGGQFAIALPCKD